MRPLRRNLLRPSKGLLLLSVLASLLAGTPLPVPAQEAAAPVLTGTRQIYEQWVILMVDGHSCGFGSTLVTRTDTPSGPFFLTRHEEQFVVKRYSMEIKIVEKSEVTEDADGGVLNFSMTTTGLGGDMNSTGKREGDDLIVSGGTEVQRYHLPRLDALGPEKVRHLTEAVPLKPGQPFSFKAFSPEYPQASVQITGTVVGQEKRDVRGTPRNLWKLTTEASIMPGLVSTVWGDDHSQDVESLTPIPGIGDLHEYVTDKAECQKTMDGAPEMPMTQVRTSRPLPSPKSLSQAFFHLTAIDPSKKLTLWNEGEQKVTPSGTGAVDVEVTNTPIASESITWQLPHADTPELHEYLQPSTYLESNNPQVQEMAKLAIGSEKNPVLAAHKIENFVRAFITRKDFNVPFGTALQTVQSREGDCTEHAVLCAALGRSVGLPTRCVVGLAYLPPSEEGITADGEEDTGQFQFHMWAEAWVGPNQWVPMDAALDGFDVAHLAIIKTSLKDVNPLVDINAPVLQLTQNLKLDVVKTVPKTATQ